MALIARVLATAVELNTKIVPRSNTSWRAGTRCGLRAAARSSTRSTTRRCSRGPARTRLWPTTSDNVDALRFSQRRGFRLAALRRGAVDDSRANLKPEIPEVGAHETPRDELELEQEVGHDEYYD